MPASPRQKLSLGSGEGYGMWNQNPRPFPSSHPSGSLGSSLSLLPLTHQARATFTSLFPYLLASFSHLRSLLSFRNPEPPPTAPRSSGRRYNAHFRFPSVPLGLGSLWVVPPLLDLRLRNMAAAARGWWRGLVWAVALPRGEQGTADEARDKSSGAAIAGSPSGLTLRSCAFYLPVQWPGDPRCCCR